MRKHTKGNHPGLETHGRCHQKSKTAASVALKKGLVSYKILKKPSKLGGANLLFGQNFPKNCMKMKELMGSTQDRRHQKSKTGRGISGDVQNREGYQWPHEKYLCPPNFFFKKET